MSDDDDSDPKRDSLAPVEPGDILLDKYRVDRVLGAGGMGVVVAATHIELEEKVAIKFLRPEVLKNEEALQRFLREARAAVRIKSEHVARVIDVGRLDTGAPYMVLEYLEGSDLSDAIKEAPPSIEDGVDYVIQACDAMAEAHAAGIVHRDLKPANLFRSQRADGSFVIKVLDFGISKVAVPDIAEAALTRTATAMGSPLYMSPEQMRSSRDVDLRSDIWSLGVILFELAAGKTPFSGSTFPELCASVLGSAPRPLREFRPDAPEGLEQVIIKCLEKEPWDRYKSVAELAKALLPFAPDRSRVVVERIGKILERAGMPSFHDMDVTVTAGSVTASAPAAATSTDVGARTASSWAGTQGGEDAPSAPKSKFFLGLGAAAVVAAGIGLAFFAKSTSADTEASAAAAQPSATASQVAAKTAEVPEVLPAPPASSAPEVVAPPEVSAAPAVKAGPSPRPAAKPTAKPAPKPEAKKPEPPAPKPDPQPPKPAKNPLDMGLK